MIPKLERLLGIVIVTLAIVFFVTHKNVLAQDANTALLLHIDGTDGSTTFTDSSNSAHTITANGNAQIDTAQSKFGGASSLFDGSGDYLSVPDHSGFTFGNGNFTIDGWIRLNEIGRTQQIYMHTSVSAYGVNILVHSSNKLRLTLSSNGSSNDIIGLTDLITTTTLVADKWYHFAVLRDGTTARLFLDGTEEDTHAVSTTSVYDSSEVVYIGSEKGTGNHLNGSIDELRISKGVARWTTNFTPDTEPYGGSTQATNTKLLLHMDGTDGSAIFTDSSDSTHTVTANGNAKVSTTHSKFGGASGYFDGSGDYLSVPDSDDWDFGSEDFTLEAWVNPATVGDTQYMIVQRPSSGIAGSVQFILGGAPPGDFLIVSFVNSSDTAVGSYASTAHIAAGVWTHVAFVRNGSTSNIYINGVAGTTENVALGTKVIENLTAPLLIGIGIAPPYFEGYLDEIRITKGVARWTANFTPPTAPYGGGTPPPLTGGGDGNSLDAADGSPTDAVFVDDEGNVGIGTINPGIYKLAVNGTIKTKEIVVELTGW
jgi:hypothetical protein